MLNGNTFGNTKHSIYNHIYISIIILFDNIFIIIFY